MGDFIVIVFLIFLVIINLALTAWMFHKIRRLHLGSFGIHERVDVIHEKTFTLYEQLQAYQDLVLLLNPQWPLPTLRGWAASPDFLKVLAVHVLDKRPGVIMECGSGASTVVLARCCQKLGAGRVVSLEHEAEHLEKTRQSLQQHGLVEFVTLVHAPLVPYPNLGDQPWYSLKGLELYVAEGIDMLVVDGPPWRTASLARYPALPLLKSWMNPRGAIFLDDANRKQERAIVARWLKEFPEFDSHLIPAEKGCVVLHAK